jgi:DNA-binding transcriptional MerR regulator
VENFDVKQLTKLYYSIGEVAVMFSVNASLIRFWEKEFPVIQPKKSKKGNRMFSPKDLDNFNKIYILVKEKGYTLDGAKKAMKQPSTPSPTKEENQTPSQTHIVEKLEQIKERLINLKKM